MQETKEQLLVTSLLVQFQKHGRRKFIEDTVKVYRSDYNEEYVKHLKEVHLQRNKQANKYASTPDKEMRPVVSIPNRLFYFIDRALIEMSEPRFLSEKKELEWFLKTFPEFQVPEKY